MLARRIHLFGNLRRGAWRKAPRGKLVLVFPFERPRIAANKLVAVQNEYRLPGKTRVDSIRLSHSDPLNSKRYGKPHE